MYLPYIDCYLQSLEIIEREYRTNDVFKQVRHGRTQRPPARLLLGRPLCHGPTSIWLRLGDIVFHPEVRLLRCQFVVLFDILCPGTPNFKGSMPPSIGHMELLVWMQKADFSEHIQGCKSPGDPLNSSHFDAPNTKSAPTGYRRAPDIISHHYKQQLSAKASIIPKARPIRFR